MDKSLPHICVQFRILILLEEGRDSSVGIATRYGLDGPEIESWWGGRDFPHPSRPAPGAHPGSGCKYVSSPVPAQECHGVTFTFSVRESRDARLEVV